jgi:hypothetical protein
MFFASGEDNREIWSKQNMSILTLSDNINKDTSTQNMSNLDDDKTSKEESKASVQTENDSEDNDL